VACSESSSTIEYLNDRSFLTVGVARFVIGLNQKMEGRSGPSSACSEAAVDSLGLASIERDASGLLTKRAETMAMRMIKAVKEALITERPQNKETMMRYRMQMWEEFPLKHRFTTEGRVVGVLVVVAWFE
jgi:hypothetical protein